MKRKRERDRDKEALLYHDINPSFEKIARKLTSVCVLFVRGWHERLRSWLLSLFLALPV